MNRALLALVVAMATTTPAFADDDISSQERSRVLVALQAQGCSNPDEMEREDGGYEVDDAQCDDGVYDFHLSGDFEIVERDKKD